MIPGVRDFSPTVEQISLHGLGFIQLKLPSNMRLHVWHPDLPRRACFDHSAVHNHRFSFHSLVLIGRQANRLWHVASDPQGEHDLVSHDGPRSEKGGRLSYVSDRVRAEPVDGTRFYEPGQSYVMPMWAYHDTPNTGVVVTLMTKIEESRDAHASTIIKRGHLFDQSFDRFQLPPDELWKFVVDALKQGALA